MGGDPGPGGNSPGMGQGVNPGSGQPLNPALQTRGRNYRDLGNVYRQQQPVAGRITPSMGGQLPTYDTGTGSSIMPGPATQPVDQGYSSAAVPGGEKAFTGYKPPPTMSPYLQMYTSRTANGTIDPYNNGVRPMIEQGQANQKFSAQIGGLRSSLNRQGAALNRLNNQEMPVQQGLVNPQYFINYQQFYPGAAQTGQTIGPQQ